MSKERIVNASELIQDDHNFNKGTDEGRKLLKESLLKYGGGRSMLIDKDNRIIAGNKTQEQADELGMKIRIIESDGSEIIAVKRTDVSLDSKQGREMAYLDNLTTQVNLAWDEAEIEQMDVEGFDTSQFGVDISKFENPYIERTEDEEIERKKKEFEAKMAAGELDEDDPEYQEFLKKFEAKKTTDDCYTPELVYDAVADWVASEYNLSRSNFVRPFYPGGDYQKEKYKPTDVVVDNPPFSILASIIDWYNEHNVKFFLFGPQLTLLNTTANRCTCLAVGVQITYKNGAEINTSFATNLEDKDIVARTDGRLYAEVRDANDKGLKTMKKKFPKYSYPKNLILSPFLQQLSHFNINFTLNKNECYQIDALDSQKPVNKAIYGSGFLISNRLLAEREKLEEKLKKSKEEHKKLREEQKKADAIVWELSDRERKIIESLK